MIELTELRLGNCVLAEDRVHIIRSLSDSKYDPIRLIDFKGAKIEVNGPGKMYPIPLTPRILEHLGFVQSEQEFSNAKMIYTLGRFQIAINIDAVGANDNYFYVSYKGSGEDIDATISSLHQLQNVYRSLTHEELRILQVRPTDSNK